MVLNKGPTFSFVCGYSVFPTPLVKKTVLSPLDALETLIENHLPMYLRFYFSALYSIPLVYMSVFKPLPRCFDNWSFIISFEIRKCETSNIVLFQDCFHYSGSVRFYMNFRMDFSISIINVIGIFVGIALTL